MNLLLRQITLTSFLVFSLGQTANVYAGTTILRFPPGFKWCVATAAHQIEGGNVHSDHYVWETAEANRVVSRELLANPGADAVLAALPSAFSTQKLACPTVLPNQNIDQNHQIEFTRDAKVCEYSGGAADHWNRVEQDTQLIKALGVQDYRFSVEWAKIEPEEGQFDEAALAHYRDEVRGLIENGISPQVTLFHFTMPQWLRAKGGWENDRSPEFFTRFTKKVYESIGPQVGIWYTLNEPMVHIMSGYITGVLPPGKTNGEGMFKAIKNLLNAHAAAYTLLHDLAALDGHEIKVGIAHHLRVIEPNNRFNPAEVVAAKVASELWNWMILDAVETGQLLPRITFYARLMKEVNLPMPSSMKELLATSLVGVKGTQDFIGINYYTRDFVKVDLTKAKWSEKVSVIVNPEAVRSGQTSDLKWEIYPKGIYKVIKAAHSRALRDGGRDLQIMISENGIADRVDAKRTRFLEDHLAEVHRAIADGIDVIGYCHWSLMDNFEWNSGYYPRFGLYQLNYETMVRTPRPSAQWFSQTVRSNGFALQR